MLYDDDKRPGEDETGKDDNKENNDYGDNREDMNPERNKAPSYSYYGDGSQPGEGKKQRTRICPKRQSDGSWRFVLLFR